MLHANDNGGVISEIVDDEPTDQIGPRVSEMTLAFFELAGAGVPIELFECPICAGTCDLALAQHGGAV